MILQGFCGSTETVRSRNVNAERTINWYEERAPGTPKVNPWLVPTPGVYPFVVLGAGPIRAIFYQDGRCFAVGGPVFYEIYANQTWVFRGGVATGTGQATISSNGTAGNQLFVTAGGFGYIFNLSTNVWTTILDPGFLLPSAMGAFLNGYFLSLHQGTRQFQFSDLEDGLTWDPTDVDEVSQSSDNLIALAVHHGEIWLMGSKTTAVWANLTDADNPFAPIPGAKLQQGIVGAFAWTIIDNTLYWVTQTESGVNQVVRASGYQPEEVSNPAIGFRLSQYQNLDQLILWSYQEEGHSHVVLYPPSPGDVPDGPVSFTLDTTTGKWHERALWDSTLLKWQPHIGRCATRGFNRILVGARNGPTIYEMDLDYATDTLVTIT